MNLNVISEEACRLEQRLKNNLDNSRWEGNAVRILQIAALDVCELEHWLETGNEEFLWWFDTETAQVFEPNGR